ncbi:MAG: TauD/TfdA family dioxygenase [Actinomycetia bacterium]|nr:TauD/TfdA family dioxygenase [Actinomycetes bacterium]MCP3913379.1 TauD/TfdA family dioxygenase [Actinomycetes bacterium]MCP4084496.1 TauD/TfdA family dioxygenase [Actinomycetes bacterium]
MSATTFELERLEGKTFGAVVRNIDLKNLGDVEWEAVRAAWIEYGLLVFPGQFLSIDEQNSFAERFGDLEFPAAPISNVTKDGAVHSDPAEDLVKSLRGNEGWHHDSTYMPVQAKGAVFTAEVVPAGGADTGFADMRAAYQALDTETRDLVQDLVAYHSLYYSQGRVGYLPRQEDDGSYGMYGYHDHEVSVRPLVRVHPETGISHLNIGRHAHNIPGMDPDESEKLLDRLNEEAIADPDRVYFHQWTEGDAIVWDNRSLMHCATPFDMTQARVMWHTRIAGERESEAALNHA